MVEGGVGGGLGGRAYEVFGGEFGDGFVFFDELRR